MSEENPTDILLAIPAFNEGARLGAFLPDLCENISTNPAGITVQVVDDGSQPADSAAMRTLVEWLRPAHPFLRPLLVLEKNRGKGGAIYAAWDAAEKFEWLAFVDADGAVPASEAVRLAGICRGEPQLDALLGNRIKMLGREIERSALRHYVGRAHATISSNLTGLAVYDSQCGLKFVRRRCYLRIRPRLETLRFGFDMELIALLHQAGCTLREEPLLSWRDVPGGKVRIARDSLEMLLSLLKLRKKLRSLESGF